MAKTNNRKIEFLKIRAEGCRKHPSYRARRPATGKRQQCVVIWNARLELNDMSAEQETTVHQYWNALFPSR